MSIWALACFGPIITRRGMMGVECVMIAPMSKRTATWLLLASWWMAALAWMALDTGGFSLVAFFVGLWFGILLGVLAHLEDPIIYGSRDRW